MPQTPPRKPLHKSRNRVRIIGGAWRSRLIEFPDVPGLRPTPGRVRETLFNWLGQRLTGKRCLDLFAGSGVLGFEAASRGADEVILVESDRAAVAALEESQRKLPAPNCRIVRGDAMAWLARPGAGFDVIFIDPPFASGLLPKVLPLLPGHLNGGGLVYAEWDEAPAAWLAAHPQISLEVVREGRAGNAFFALLSAKLSNENPSP
ncbi:MAG: 16S rRNA (guanine(966)-N(2))-methyltransferase RsmD [Betaproteobacteria bacterium]|nr:16S rRNA (guanine(966)-N(2))-methyltransferase RsmD [Betaproteobacteria bacterium]